MASTRAAGTGVGLGGAVLGLDVGAGVAVGVGVQVAVRVGVDVTVAVGISAKRPTKYNTAKIKAIAVIHEQPLPPLPLDPAPGGVRRFGGSGRFGGGADDLEGRNFPNPLRLRPLPRHRAQVHAGGWS